MSVGKIRPTVSNKINPDQLAINTLKIVGVEMVTKAASGHPGIVISAATLLHTLVTRHLVYDPQNPLLLTRDRLILSAGHGSALLYTYLAIIGLFSEEELAQFRQFNSVTPGHPEHDPERGIEATTGPLGQGIANAVGLALARAHLNAKFPEFDHYVYAICGDGDLQEGVAQEALSFAGSQALNRLIILYDSNDIQLDSEVGLVFRVNLKSYLESLGWEYYFCQNNIEEIDQALTKAKTSQKPVFIEVKTIIGEGTSKAGTKDVHGAPLKQADINELRASLGYNQASFVIADEVKNYYKLSLQNNLKQAQREVSDKLLEYLNQKEAELILELDLPKNQATRVVSELVNNKISELLPTYIGGSADLSTSTKIYGGDGIFLATNRIGRNILFGVREFAMAGIANGIALHSNLRPFVSTFLVFADYLKPAMRLSALMRLPVSYIFSHDSVFVGEDGPTHQPVEQLAMLRSIPGLRVLRPADEIETKASFELALRRQKAPTVIITTRQNLPSLKTTDEARFKDGFYFIRRSKTNRFSLIASGSELALALELGNRLDLNVISASNYSFSQTPLTDPNSTISIEAATSFGWAKFARYNFAIDNFGISAPGEIVYKSFGFEVDSLEAEVIKIIRGEE